MSRATERRRHEALAREIGSWTSWSVRNWFTDGYLGIALDDPFSLPNMRMEFECSCSQGHPWNPALTCMFVDAYEPDATIHGVFTRFMGRAMARHRRAIVTVERESFDHPNEIGATCYRARIADDDDPNAWLAVQTRYIDAIERHANPTRWCWFGPDPDDDMVAPYLMALRGDQVVGIVMPMGCTGSALEVVLETPRYTGASMLPAPAGVTP